VNCQPWIKLLSTQQKIKKNKYGEKGKKQDKKEKHLLQRNKKTKVKGQTNSLNAT
jgi:hypothetical protein